MDVPITQPPSDAEPPRLPVAAGTALGRYRLAALLGAGGMGEVFVARDALLGRDVAVKILPAQFASDAHRLARFEREARSLAALSHPNILAIYDYGVADGVPFAVMELLTGQTLRDRLRQVPPLPWREALGIALAIAEGLAAAHGRGIVHRDLKPANLFVTGEGIVKILDFGLAGVRRSPEAAGSATDPDSTGLTGPGVILGTLGYAAPEQLRGEATDARSDLFALGCVLYEMVAGRPAFLRSAAAETYAATLRDEPPPAPAVAADLIGLCLAKAPEERFASARALAEALRARLAGPAASLPPQPRRGPPDSLAVLPFADGDDASATEHLGEAVSEGILDRVSRFPRLRVAARAAAFRFNEPGADPRSVGHALAVAAVLTGQILRRAGGPRLRVALIDVADGAVLWAGEYVPASGDDGLAAEAELTERVSEDLRPVLCGDQPQQPRREPPVIDAEARRLHLRGRYHYEKRTEDDFRKSGEYYREAIALQPDYALAYAALAELHAQLGSWGTYSPKVAFPLAAQLARRALELDGDLAEGHAAVAFVRMGFDWDWLGAEAEYRRALELNPNYATAHARYAYLLLMRGRFTEALARMRHAQQLDPLSQIIRANVGYALYFLRRYEEAEAEFQAALSMNPRFPTAYYCLGLTCERRGEWDRAVAAFGEAITLSGGVPGDIHALCQVLARAGRREEAEAAHRRLAELAGRRHVPPCFIGTSHLVLGRLDAGFEWLERAYGERDFYLIYLPVDPRQEEFRDDPRFASLARRIEAGSAEATP